jgi:hypothetical protein
MNEWKVTYKEQYSPSPVSFWVHKHLDDPIWMNATEFDPPLPKSVPGKGYPVLKVIFQDVKLTFSSIEEVEHFVDVVGQKNMPTSQQLSAKRNTKSGPNSHWLSRLPGDILSWKKREKLLKIMDKAIVEYRKAFEKK